MKEINVLFIEKKMVHEFNMFSDYFEFINSVNDDQSVTVLVSYNTKKSLHVSLYHKQMRFGFNREVEGFKTLDKKVENIMDYGKHRASFFKVLKNQGLDEFTSYLTESISSVFDVKDGFNIVIEKTQPIIDLTAKDIKDGAKQDVHA